MDFAQADALNRAIRLIALRHRTRALAELAPLGLHPGQEVALLELGVHGPRTQTQLAAGCGCEPPTVTVMLQKLEGAGLISRWPSPTDARVMLADLTDRGRALVNGPLREAWLRLAETTVAGLADRSLDELQPVLDDLVGSLAPDRTSTTDH